MVQSVTNKDEASTQTSLTVTLSSFGGTQNGTFGVFSTGGDTDGHSAGSGFSIVGVGLGGTSGGVSGTTEFKSTNDTSVDMTLSSGLQFGGMAVELKAAAIASGSGNTTFIYDANGNMINNGLHIFEYNEGNQLKRVKLASNSATLADYIYDYRGQRIVKKNYLSGNLTNTVTSWTESFETKDIVGGSIETTIYYYANGELLAKKKPDGSLNYVHNDHLGSSSVITNSGGSLVESTSYDPWGVVTSGGTASKYGYTGQEKDSESGLNYYKSRYYGSEVRRFTQPDSIISNLYDPQSLNRYAYAHNNPLKYTDPTGHVNELLAYNNALNAYNKKPSVLSYNNVLNVASSIQKQGGVTSQSGGGNNNKSGSNNGQVAGASTQNSKSEPDKPNILTFQNSMKDASLHKVSEGSFAQRKANAEWFYNKVHSYGDWDLKNKYEDCKECEDLGNIMFGAVAREAGFSEYVAENGAGVYQIKNHLGKDMDMQGIPVFLVPFGDTKRDYFNIKVGYNKVGTWY